MKYTNKDLKIFARGSLLGHYGTVIGVFIFINLILWIINIPFNQMIQQGLNYSAVSRTIIGIIGSFLVSLLSILLEVGLTHIHLQIARKQGTRFSELFFVFKSRPDRYLGYSIIMLIISVVCVLPGTLVLTIAAISEYALAFISLYLVGSILLLLGGIILIVVTLGFALTPYILLDNPSMGLLDTFKLSFQLMKGYKWRLFALRLSFLGWIFFSLLSFGLGLLWVIPYINQTDTWFYMGFISDDPEE